MKYKNYINGKWQDAKSGKKFAVENPFNQEIIAHVPDSNKVDINMAVSAAKNAYLDWRLMSAGERRDLMRELANKSRDNAKDLAKICLDILSVPNRSSKKGKLYHYSNEGVTSWYDFAVTIMELAGLNCKVKSVLTKDYSNTAKRPHYSVLNKTKIKEDFKIVIPHWKDSLKECISKLKQ